MPWLLFKVLYFGKWILTAGWIYSRDWEEGRQQTGYHKKTIFSSDWLGMDCHILRYGEGASIPPHLDPVKGKRHYRANLTLWRADMGGTFGGGYRILDLGRLIVFRPDMEPKHWVGEVHKGKRYILSFGWVRN